MESEVVLGFFCIKPGLICSQAVLVTEHLGSGITELCVVVKELDEKLGNEKYDF